MRSMECHYQERNYYRKQQRVKVVRRNILLLALSVIVMVMIAVMFFSFSTQASDQAHQTSYKYFRSIEIKKGDSLWSIASCYADAHYENLADYVSEVKRMNGLSSENIQAGSYLIIPYYSTEFLSSETN